MENKISVCIIAKNEEQCIEQCILSVLPIAYEVIVLDTGSSDKTKEIAKKNKARVYETKWENDFSKARNECISYAKGDWILSIDANEILTEETQKNLLKFLSEQPYKNQAVVFNFKIINPQSAGFTSSFFRNALFRAGFGINYVKTIHEHLYSSNKNLLSITCDFLSIYHLGGLNSTREYLVDKTNRYLPILEKAIKDDPKNSFYYYLYLGNSYSMIKESEKALESYFKSYQLFNKNTNEKGSFYCMILTKIYNELIFSYRDFKRAMYFIEELLTISPTFPDALVYLAFCYQNLNNYKKAIDIYEHTLRLLETSADALNPLGIVSMGKDVKIMLAFELSRCYIAVGNIEKGKKFLETLYTVYKDSFLDTFVCKHLIRLYIFKNDLASLLKYYIKVNKNISAEKINRLTRISTISPNNGEYKRTLLKILNEIRDAHIWSEDEDKNILAKIEELQAKHI